MQKVIEIEYLYIIRSSVLSLLSFLSINIEEEKKRKNANAQEKKNKKLNS